MNEATEQLRGLAHRLAEIYLRRTRPRAILLAGSAARGDADFYSDLDLILYYDELPPADAREAAREEVGGEACVVLGETEGVHSEQYLVSGVACQAAHFTVSRFEAGLDAKGIVATAFEALGQNLRGETVKLGRG